MPIHLRVTAAFIALLMSSALASFALGVGRSASHGVHDAVGGQDHLAVTYAADMKFGCPDTVNNRTEIWEYQEVPVIGYSFVQPEQYAFFQPGQCIYPTKKVISGKFKFSSGESCAALNLAGKPCRGSSPRQWLKSPIGDGKSFRELESGKFIDNTEFTTRALGVLGKVDYAGFCKSKGFNAAVPGNDGKTWICGQGSGGPSDTTRLRFNEACTWQYGDGASGLQQTPGDVHSWVCNRDL